MIEISIDRTSLSEDTLVLTPDFTGDFWLDENIGRPNFTFRKKHAPESDYAAGQVLLAAVMDQADVSFTVYAHADTTAALDALMTDLESALAQFIYEVTVTIDGVAKVYEAECSMPAWGPIDSGEVRAHLVRAAVSIPVNPPGA